MNCQFQILSNNQLDLILPLVYELNEGNISKPILRSRFAEMKNQNYECVVIKKDEAIVGVSGLWFCTRHYSGKSVELDHVFIKPEHRGQGLGKAFMEWIYNYCKSKGCESIELNTYVQNYPSHKFYYNEGFILKGYHFFKTL
ncbi:MAG: GNAT family N-acetyltransferase [Winogradskyella sp.]|uniref:GNAT family N-acetyltransferase n=1 Tax=Winogradskyella sp. TaxID=1883156 RepID=UPI0025FC543C|nr:GNAT family N-acetyltransferase [Winogradskyella sp.]NRB60031.1 GNAT family N-acetyltransferase [Winogradskyella sp.]